MQELLFKANEIIRWLSADEETFIDFKTLGIPDDCNTFDDMLEFANKEDFNYMIALFIDLMFTEIKRNYGYGK